MCDLDLSTRYAVHLPTPEQLTHLHINLMLIGCGGTGSALAPSLARIAFHGQRKGIRFHIIFVDPDIVDESNVGRQRFTPGAEIGLPKANCLTTRLNLAFGLDIAAIAAPFSAELLSYFPESPRSHIKRTLLIGAVDNNVARRAIHDVVSHNQGRAWALDCGNARFNGHVAIGNLGDPERLTLDKRIGLANGIPSPYLQEPLLLQTDPEPEQPASCAELALADEQSIMVNEMVAAIAGRYVDQFALQGRLSWLRTLFNLAPPTVTTIPLTARQMEVNFATTSA